MTITAIAACLFAGAAGQPSAAATLGERYVDGTYAFAIRPPRGWTVVQRREAEPSGEIVLRMNAPQPDLRPKGEGVRSAPGPRDPAEVHEIRVRRITRRSEASIAEILKGLAFQIEFEHPDCKIESQQQQDIAGRAGGMISATFKIYEDDITIILALVRVAPESFLIVQSTSPTVARKKTEPLFLRVLGSLEILADQNTQRKLSEALERGAAWQKALTAERLIQSLPDEEFYVYELDGRPLGLSRLNARPLRHQRFDGYELFEEVWLFDVPGTARRIQTKVFIRDDLQYERFRRSQTTWIQASADGPERLENDYEDQFRDRTVLLTAQTHSIDAPLEQNPALDVDDKYMTPMLVRLFPRLLGDLTQTQTLAFLTFDHVRLGLIVRVFECAGPADPPPGVAATKCYKILDREGVADAATVYVDAAGRPVYGRMGKLVMKPADRARLEALFGPRVAEASAAIARLEREYEQYWKGHTRSLRRGD